jgi:peptidoglycan/LPS O-acetylase OafA/YrhL
MVFGLFPNFNEDKAKHLSRAENILYQGSSRSIWGAALAFIIFSCCMKRGGVFNEMFCWPIWTPLSRLSFAAYLIHVDVLSWYNYQLESPFYFKEIHFVSEYEF